MSGRPARILLADDDQVVLLVTRAALESGGFAVSTACDGIAALESFDRETPDCVILDVMMPRMDGFAACREIRSRPAGKDVPILVLTSLDDLTAVSRAYESGATDFAGKGLGNRLLHERIRFLLRAYSVRQALRASRSRLHAVQDMARVGHWEVAADGATIDVSPIVREILGLDGGKLDHLNQLRDALRPPAGERLTECIRRWLADSAGFELDARAASGSFLYIRGATTSHRRSDEPRSLTLAIQDVTAVRQAQRHARRLAHFDVLTGLPNKRRFLQSLGDLLQDRPELSSLSVLAVGISGHERLVQSTGAAAADQALVTLSRVLRATTLQDEHASRRLGYLDSGQFAIALPATDSTAAAAFCERLLDALARPISGPGWVLAVEARAGIALWPQDGKTADELLTHAQAAGGRLVAESGDRYAFFSPEIRERARRRLDLESGLRNALERRELALVYQPRIDLEDLTVRGAEALLRWHHPTLGTLSPREFIPVAEATGMIEPIGQWVLAEACRQVAAWRSEFNRALTVSVNVSARQLQSPGELLHAVRSLLVTHALPAGALELELTESMIIHAGEELLETLAALRTMGISVALDDFGTGYSSLAYLTRLPVDTIKIDQSFVAQLPEDASAEGILRAILSVASALKLNTVAEGIERAEQYYLLRDRGCPEGQGFLFARPLAPSAFGTFFRSPVRLPAAPVAAAG